MQNAFLESESAAGTMAIGLKSDWIFGNVRALRNALDGVDASGSEHVTFQCGGLDNIDIAGAWVLFRKSHDIQATGRTTDFKGFKAAHFKYLNNITGVTDTADIADDAIGPTEAGK